MKMKTNLLKTFKNTFLGILLKNFISKISLALNSQRNRFKHFKFSASDKPFFVAKQYKKFIWKK